MGQRIKLQRLRITSNKLTQTYIGEGNFIIFASIIFQYPVINVYYEM